METKDQNSIQCKNPSIYKQTKLNFYGGKLTVSRDVISDHKNNHKPNSWNPNIDCSTASRNSININEKNLGIARQPNENQNSTDTILGNCDGDMLQKLDPRLPEFLHCEEIQSHGRIISLKSKRASSLSPSVHTGPKRRKFRKISENQMLLDAGQRKFGITQCSECKFVYHIGELQDETIHQRYHEAQHILSFTGWKEERVVSKLDYGRIIHILPSDPTTWKKKIKLLLDFINRDLGYFDEFFLNTNNMQVFLFIKSRAIVGCLAAEQASVGRKMLTTHSDTEFCSEETYPIKCGVSRIWVSQSYRRQKIATLLLDSLKKNFQQEYILTNMDIAFGSPTELGTKFAAKYFGTANFLVYGV